MTVVLSDFASLTIALVVFGIFSVLGAFDAVSVLGAAAFDASSALALVVLSFLSAFPALTAASLFETSSSFLRDSTFSTFAVFTFDAFFVSLTGVGEPTVATAADGRGGLGRAS